MNQEYRELSKKVDILITDNKYKLLNNRLLNLEAQLVDPEIWLHPEKVARVNKEIGIVQNKLNKVEKLKKLFNDINSGFSLNIMEGVEEEIKELAALYSEVKNEEYFNGPLDHHNAIVSIHAGAGGTDAQDWASMLMAMYQTFAKNNNYSCRIISLSSGNEVGIKSATFEIEGENSYGIMKEEAGVHRLVRISPFNSGKTRETSFALVEVVPSDLIELISTFEVNEDDIDWDYFMSSGKGGQSVNTTYSAVRLTHKPTGIVVTCQNERSQQQNKQLAIKMLKNKLSLLKIEEEKDLREKLRGEIHSPEWGNQIRNYVLHPYKLIKDTRSNFETSNVEDVINYGNILPIIWSVKEFKINNTDSK
ncbi:MAG: peptide chain release factor 2 [Patescibacteria group bacterium]